MVVPYIGTWIETPVLARKNVKKPVVPYIGTWIETTTRGTKARSVKRRTLYRYVDWNASLSRVWWVRLCRTLYRYVDWNLSTPRLAKKLWSRTLYRYVDWNISADNTEEYQPVVPYIGTWIETSRVKGWCWSQCRTLYRYVDWNTLEIKTAIIKYSRTLYRYVDWNPVQRIR